MMYLYETQPFLSSVAERIQDNANMIHSGGIVTKRMTTEDR